ncbi:predicted protein [Plenodomus lingam JN3]|uniref:Predicted protein n=1 Tax=Leptosphaeria maculans (strain JN3 / isolate v23.1.3 / race Av1-4-5-6-7-8) TaxID=985895 RepID=E5R4R8_LEPMJ|nr:predicted protein [Plenodomus lingam JN3]CBX92191.1 predicted protein [Plenodomus lingam JN3]
MPFDIAIVSRVDRVTLLSHWASPRCFSFLRENECQSLRSFQFWDILMASIYFQRTLFQEQNSVDEELYDSKVAFIFEQEETGSVIEMRCWSDFVLEEYRENRSSSHPTTTTHLADHSPSRGDTERMADESLILFSPTQQSSDATEQSTAESTMMHVSGGLSELSIVDLDLLKITGYIQLTRDKFDLLLQELRVAPQFKNFTVDLCSKSGDTEIGPAQLRGCIRLDADLSKPGGYEYVGAYPRPEDCFNEYAKGTAVKERNPFELHVIFIDVAIASWRPYLIHLEELWIEFSDKASLTTMESKQPLRNHYRVQAQDYTDLKELEDHVTNGTKALLIKQPLHLI